MRLPAGLATYRKWEKGLLRADGAPVVVKALAPENQQHIQIAHRAQGATGAALTELAIDLNIRASVRALRASPVLAHLEHDGGVRLAFGGDVANSMACLGRILGPAAARVSLVTALGHSGYSAWLRERLTRAGIVNPCAGRQPSRSQSMATSNVAG